jgi:nucleoside-diphosphate-sugar epimerase
VRRTPSDGLLPARIELTTIGDIGRDTDWRASLDGIDTIFHLAGRAHVIKETETDALGAFRSVNVEGTACLVSAARAAGVRRFVHVSSVGVLGNATRGSVFDENSQPAPYNAYAASKWEAEQRLARVSNDIEVVIVRPPLVYGEGNGGNFLRLLKLVDKGLPLPLGSADGIRSMIYVGNLVDALLLCATHPRASGQTYLLRDDESVSTAEVVAKLGRLMGRSPRLLTVPRSLVGLAARIAGKSADVGRLFSPLIVDDKKIRRELGWSPPVLLDEGFARTVTWYLHSREGGRR